MLPTLKKLHMIIRYQENNLTCNAILNIEYHVALNNYIHTTPSISEHQMLNAGITKNMILEVIIVIFNYSILLT